MRHLKTLGLVAVAALAAMAFVGATSASADSICTTNAGHPNSCPVTYTGNVLGTSGSAVLLNGSKEQIEKCTGTVLGLGSTYENEGAHIGFKMLLEPLLFTNCEGICTKATGHVGSWMLVEALTLDAWVTADGALAPGAELEGCFFGVKCNYELTNAKQLLSISGNTITASQVPLTRTSGSSLCPATGFWDATYTETKDEVGGGSLFVTALP
jgi:hypothetical protein